MKGETYAGSDWIVKKHGADPLMQILQRMTPGIRKFFKEQIRHATLLGIIPPVAVDLDEMQSDFYIRILEHIGQKPQNEAKVPQWVKNEARALLKEKLNGLKKRQADISYEDLLGDWVKEMEEKIAVDAEGEVVLEEDLEDYSHGRHVSDIVA